MRGEVICSSRLGPIRHRSPIRASLTSMPRVVRFSPKKPFGSSRPSRSAQRSRSSRWKAYTAWSLPPWCLPSPMKSPTSPLPNPDRFGPGSRTWTGPRTGCLPIPVHFTLLCGLGRGRPILTESRMGTTSDYVAGTRDACGNSTPPYGHAAFCAAAVSDCGRCMKRSQGRHRPRRPSLVSHPLSDKES